MELSGLEAMNAEAARFARSLSPTSDTATIVALSGELGAGKTSFTQGLAQALGVTERVTSPTFLIEKSYNLSNQRFVRLIHIDAYRINDARELDVLGWRALLKDAGNLIVIEWPERVLELIPDDALYVRFEGSGDSRTITYG